MTSRHVPSPYLLRYLARLTDYYASSQCTIRRASPQARDFSSDQHRANIPSPRAQKASYNVDQTWASADFKGEASLNEYAEVFTSRWIARDFRTRLGMSPSPGMKMPAPELLTLSCLNGMRSFNTPKAMVKRYMGHEERYHGLTWQECMLEFQQHQLLRPLAMSTIMGQALYILGYQYRMSRSPQKEKHHKLGVYMLKIAVLLDSRDAMMLFLIQDYHGQIGGESFPSAYPMLEKLATQGDDVGVMCLRAEMLMWPKKGKTVSTMAERTEAYRLAWQAFERSEAGEPKRALDPPVNKSGPSEVVPELDIFVKPAWALLQRMTDEKMDLASDEKRELWEMVTSAGAREYDNPKACGDMVTLPPEPLVPCGSVEWVKFAMKAAMAGQADASSLLGRYYLELHEWYPPKKAAHKRDRVGFQWMEVSMHQTTNPGEIRHLSLRMALLSRHNADLKAGQRWLEMGIERLHAVAVREDGDADGCAYSIEYLDQCIDEWYRSFADLPAQTQRTWSETLLFGEPMLKAKRTLQTA